MRGFKPWMPGHEAAHDDSEAELVASTWRRECGEFYAAFPMPHGCAVKCSGNAAGPRSRPRAMPYEPSPASVEVDAGAHVRLRMSAIWSELACSPATAAVGQGRR